MSDLTRLLARWQAGDEEAERELMPLVYGELRRVAEAYLGPGEGASVSATKLVHEAYLRLLGSGADWPDRVRFYAFSARLMRNILVDHARRRSSLKRGGDALRVTFDEAGLAPAGAGSSERLIDLHRALERLERASERTARVVELHYFSGLGYGEIARVLDVSTMTVNRELRSAKSWLRKEIA